MSWVEDRLEILDLIARYSHAADGTDPSLYAACFTEDGEFHGRVGMPDEIRIVGREALTRFSAAGIARRNGTQNRHFQTNTMFIEQSADQALTRTYLMVTRICGDAPPELALTSIYEDRMVRTPEGWRIKLRQTLPDRKGVLSAEAGRRTAS